MKKLPIYHIIFIFVATLCSDLLSMENENTIEMENECQIGDEEKNINCVNLRIGEKVFSLHVTSAYEKYFNKDQKLIYKDKQNNQIEKKLPGFAKDRISSFMTAYNLAQEKNHLKQSDAELFGYFINS